MFYQCSNLEYINLKNFEETKLIGHSSMFSVLKENVVICINKNNINILETFKPNCYKIYCGDDWESNQVKLINHTSNCIINNTNNLTIYFHYEYKGNYYEKCTNGNLENRNISCVCNKEKCLKCPNEPSDENLCSECKEGFYPLEIDNNLFVENYFKCYKDPEGYYLDQNSSSYKKCYDTCKTCEQKGDNLHHNCLECNFNYPYKINYTNNNYSNCYQNCSFYHYFDEQNNFHCTNDFSCPSEYPNLIIDKLECTKEEINIDISTIISNENEITGNSIYFKNCLNNEETRNLIRDSFNKVRTKAEEIYYYDLILETIENCFTSENFDKEHLANGEEDIIITEKINITLTTTESKRNQLNNNNNISIDIGYCEILLKKFYDISINEPLYIKIINVIQEGMKIPKTEYDVYYNFSSKKLQKLNLSICENKKAFIFIPMNIKENIDIVNSSSDYYRDICYISSDDNELDIILKDRRKEFIEENKTVCQDYCDFSEYDYVKKVVKCSCDIRKSSSSFEYMNIDKSKLLKKYSDIKNILNFELLRCYKSFFNRKRIFLNIGFIILSLIIIIHIINTIIFYLRDIHIIENKLREISFEIKNSDSTQLEKNGKDDIPIIIGDYKFKKKKKRRSIKNRPISNGQIFSKANSNNINNNIIIFNGNNIIRNLPEPESKRKIINLNIKSPFEVDKYTKLNDNELNLLSYDLAKENDKRTFFEYYISLIKNKHNFIFLFFNKSDYNSKIIKFDLFVFGFSLYYAINTAFYSNEIIHKVYKDKGSYNLKYQFPLIIYSSLISFILNIIFKILVSTNDIILSLKQINSINDMKLKAKNLGKKLRIKFILYFIITFILLVFFWYYVSMFGAIYKNNQYLLLYNVLISLLLSILYPFGIYSICGLLRILSLSEPKKERKCFYNFSKIL